MKSHQTDMGYLALPESGKGPGLLFLHPWWGLTPFFKECCDRLAREGYVVFAPDLHFGKTAKTIDEAKKLMAERDGAKMNERASSAMKFLSSHSAVTSKTLVAMGFSMGAEFALALALQASHPFSALSLFYGYAGADFAKSSAKIICHFGETDEWEPIEDVKKINAPNTTVHIYPGAFHWFFEADKPEYFKKDAAELAYKRTLEFFKKHQF